MGASHQLLAQPSDRGPAGLRRVAAKRHALPPAEPAAVPAPAPAPPAPARAPSPADAGGGAGLVREVGEAEARALGALVHHAAVQRRVTLIAARLAAVLGPRRRRRRGLRRAAAHPPQPLGARLPGSGALQRLREVGRAADESLGTALLRAAAELLQPLRLLGRQPLVRALPQLPLARLCVRMT